MEQLLLQLQRERQHHIPEEPASTNTTTTHTQIHTLRLHLDAFKTGVCSFMFIYILSNEEMIFKT